MHLLSSLPLLLLLTIFSTVVCHAADSASAPSTPATDSPSTPTTPATDTPTTPVVDPLSLKWNATGYNTSQAIGVQNIPFTIISSSAPWSARYAHTIVSSGTTLLLIGGISALNSTDPSQAPRDIWKSDDLSAKSVVWTRLTDNAPFGVRQGAAAVLVNGAILLISGETLLATDKDAADLWTTVDLGVTWTRLVYDSYESGGPFVSRAYHTAALDMSTNTLVVTSGLSRQTGKPLNDVHVSTDNGESWSHSTAFWPARYGAASVWRSGVVYILGGINTNGVTLTDIWSSPDSGVTWLQVGTNGLPAGVAPRAFFTLASFAGNMILLGGSTGVDYIKGNGKDAVYGDVWLSSDAGLTWQWQSSIASFGARAHSASVLTYGRLLLVGGVNRGLVFNDMFRTDLPKGNPDADNGVVAGILGAAAGLVLAVLILRQGVNYIRQQPWRKNKKEKISLQAATAAAAAMQQDPLLTLADEAHHHGESEH